MSARTMVPSAVPKFLGGNLVGPASVRHVVPHQAAAAGIVDRLGDDEGRDVAHLAVGVLDQINILDQRVERIGGIELTERATRDLLVLAPVIAGAGLAGAECRRDAIVDDNTRDTSLG
jgi:hypothetical protein